MANLSEGLEHSDKARDYLETILNSTMDAVCTTDMEGRFVYFSPGAERMFGAKNGEMIGRYARDYYAGGMGEAQKIMRLLRRQEKIQNVETVFKTPQGRTIHVIMSISLLRDKSGRIMGTLGISKDITSRVDLERRLKEISITDGLTGLYNQRFFRERLTQEIARARRQRQKLSLLLMDLDKFKAVNDLSGHLAGDRLLKTFAAFILESIRKNVDAAFRCGGDEFIVLFPGLSETRAKAVAARIAAYAQKAGRKGLKFSYGVAGLGSEMGPKDLIDAADKRMYRMKSSRRAE
ncbi:MAG: sensor domain-containing diguanylate cyclase [Elusimicrobiota bacterium]